MLRNAPWSCLVDALVSAVVLAASALAGQSHDGKVMTAAQDTLMVETETAQVIFDVPPEAVVLLDGQAATLSALQPGFHVTVRAEERDARLVASVVIGRSGHSAPAAGR